MKDEAKDVKKIEEVVVVKKTEYELALEKVNASIVAFNKKSKDDQIALKDLSSGVSVWFRNRIGKLLAKKALKMFDEGLIRPDIVVPVPDTSRTAAISLSYELNIPYREALIKNRYVQRSFILNTAEKRERAVELKLSPVKSEIKGKNILLVDDSIVRGTTSKKIINLLNRYGAKSVTLASTCPPIRYPCFYGIDFPSINELVASSKSETEIAESIKANAIIYIDENDLIQAIGKDNLCLACLNNSYPTCVKDGFHFSKCRQVDKSINGEVQYENSSNIWK